MRKMRPSRKEIEVKLAFESGHEAREKLLAAGAEIERERTFEDNIVFDTEALELKATQRVLRLRRFGDDSLLTFKAPADGDGRHHVREEHESAVDDFDAVAEILGRLGYRPVYRYQKYRTKLRVGALEAVVDETPIGCYVELEGEPGDIDALAERLGFASERYIRATYRELHERFAAERGEPVGDMLLAEE
jgi:adenylate cyclase class 2